MHAKSPIQESFNLSLRVGLAENWRRRGKFEEIAFVFPNAPSIPITVVRGPRSDGWRCRGDFGRMERMEVACDKIRDVIHD